MFIIRKETPTNDRPSWRAQGILITEKPCLGDYVHKERSTGII